MTPQFTTPCYVRIEDADKRKEVCEKLERIGYRVTITAIISNHPSIVVFANEVYGEQFDNLSAFAEYNTYCDCGTNTDLFLALASMRSDTCLNQWFVCEESYADPMLDYQLIEIGMLVKQGEFDQYAKAFYRKATAAEIIEHFKN